ncbi:DUF3085 domain-containing protein [Bradyrhizobium stylosanthis]|uniref:DUF3085 family protein n=1 Tax=Bradyrhizobium stylosanthis TaxID=1803665 RepID=A0A560ECU2_9BRAD|nr:DUF3085 domain-containing protein [Bradyrhizobium stylosanthis]TWB07192.1 DUF3085 family protein [Bradyrhizobium stylosanthis]
MKQLIFDADDVRRVVKHSLAAAAQGGLTIGHDPKTGTAITEPVAAAAVILGCDEGVYLMSNGQPRDLLGEASPRSFTAYARGCHPSRDRHWRTNARELVGDDDFSCVLPWAHDLEKLLDAGATVVVLNVDDGAVELADG